MSMRKLVYEYKQSIRKMKAAYEAADPEDMKIISGMIRDMEYAVKWMESGRDPKNNHRDAERSRVYYYDPVILDQMREKMSQKALIPAQADIEQVDSFLSACLTKREDDVYRLYIGEGMSMAKIGELLHIAKTSVQNLVERAENKVDEEKEQVRLF